MQLAYLVGCNNQRALHQQVLTHPIYQMYYLRRNALRLLRPTVLQLSLRTLRL
jgi:hypothetical protein